MRAMRAFVLVLAACGSTAPTVVKKPVEPGKHQAAIAAQFQPLVDHGIVSGLVVGVYDAGKVEVYGFGKGPGGARPDGNTLFELGAVTKIYTALLLADSVQRKEVALDTPVSELLPPGITMPTKDGKAITLGHLALHVSGLPRLPPSVDASGSAADPYGKYGENALYQDLLHTQLEHAPGEQIQYSNFGSGLLGFVLGPKLGGYAKAMQARVLEPLSMHDTFITVPAAAAARRAPGTNDDLAPVPAWTFDALAGAGALVSTAQDQLELIEAELEASAGSKQGIRGAMRFTQEPQLQGTGDNEGLGWQIDGSGRYWHNGGTGGYHAFISFDPKTRRGFVVMASTAVSAPVDHLSDVLYRLLAGEAVPPPTFPSNAQLAPLVGHYDLAGHHLELETKADRLYLEGEGTKVRLVPFSDREFWIEELQSGVAFQREGDKIARMLLVGMDRQIAGTRTD